MTAARPAAGNAALAALARERFRTAPVRSVRRKAAGVLHAALAETKTPEAARRLLARHRIPAEIRTAAEQLLADLISDTESEPPA